MLIAAWLVAGIIGAGFAIGTMYELCGINGVRLEKADRLVTYAVFLFAGIVGLAAGVIILVTAPIADDEFKYRNFRWRLWR